MRVFCVFSGSLVDAAAGIKRASIFGETVTKAEVPGLSIREEQDRERAEEGREAP